MQVTFEQRDVAERPQPLEPLPQGLRGRSAGGQEQDGHVGPERLLREARLQRVQGFPR